MPSTDTETFDDPTLVICTHRNHNTMKQKRDVTNRVSERPTKSLNIQYLGWKIK
jgi:hypothetical protein